MGLFDALVVFGRNLLDGTVSSTVLLIILIEAALLAVVLVALAIVLIVKRAGDGRDKDVYVSTNQEEGPEIQELILNTAAVRKQFERGGEFDCEGLLVTAHFSDGTEEPVSDYIVDSPDLSAEGEATVTISYRTMSAHYNVKVVNSRKAEELFLDTSNVKTKFFVGEEFNCDGLVVTARFADGTEEVVDDYSVEYPSTETEGERVTLVTYEGVTAEYRVDVIADEVRKLTDIVVNADAARRVFAVGEEFDSDGLVVTARYSDGAEVQIGEYTVLPPQLDEVGMATVTVRYEDATAEYTIEVEAAPERTRELLFIELDASLAPTEFTENEEFSSEGLAVIAHYDLEPLTEKVDSFTVDAPDMTRDGVADVVVHYEGMTAKYPVVIRKSRSLVGISLDTGVVQREFALGEEFNSVGLIVTANYDAAPLSEQVEDFKVIPPDMTVEGKPTVTVEYLDKSAVYTISVAKVGDVAATKQFIIDEESAEAGVLRYDRSFTARLIQSEDEIKNWYTQLKNELLSYKKVKDRMSWKRETYRFAKGKVALFGFRGKALCLFLALDPAEFADSKYKVEDVSDNASFAETPLMYRIKNDRRVKYAMELIATAMERKGAIRTERESQDYYLPYEGLVELINKGLIKRNIKTGAQEAIFYVNGEEVAPVASQEVAAEPIAETTATESQPIARSEAEVEDPTRPEAEVATTELVTEPAPIEPIAVANEHTDTAPAFDDDLVKDGDVVQNWSFKARMSRSYDDVKAHYGELKNEMMAYGNVGCKLKWRNEVYSANKNRLAKFGFIDRVFCVFLALDPAVYDGAGYLVQDVSNEPGYAETPLMFAIRSDRDVRLALDLIADLMHKFDLKKGPAPAEDYYEPYKEVEELISTGMIKLI